MSWVFVKTVLKSHVRRAACAMLAVVTALAPLPERAIANDRGEGSSHSSSVAKELLLETHVRPVDGSAQAAETARLTLETVEATATDPDAANRLLRRAILEIVRREQAASATAAEHFAVIVNGHKGEELTPDKLLQRRQKSVLFATLQAGARTASMLVGSSAPLEAKAISFTISYFTSLFFKWDQGRWGRFLDFGASLPLRGLKLLGVKRFESSKTVETTLRSATGFVGTAAFTALYLAIAQWGAPDPDFLQKVLANTFTTWVISQPYQNVFDGWSKEGHKVFTEDDVENLRHIKGLAMTAISALLMTDARLLGFALGGVALVGGFALAVMDHLKDARPKKIFQGLWSKVRDRARRFTSCTEALQSPGQAK
jgi:hypothetical protein